MTDAFFGLKLKELRKSFSLTQKGLADIIDVSKTTICQWETSKQEPSITDIKKIAVYFDVSADELLGIETKKEKEQIRMQINKSFLAINNKNITKN